MARAASGRAGLAVAGDLAGLRRWLEIWRGCGGGWRSGGVAAVAGDLAGLWQAGDLAGLWQAGDLAGLWQAGDLAGYG